MPDSFIQTASSAQASMQHALDDLEALTKKAAQLQGELQRDMQVAIRAGDLAQYDKTQLREWLARPYLTRPLGEGQYELIVPTFIGFSAGWPLRHIGPYSVFMVTRFINLINPLPDWLSAELGFAAPTWHGTLNADSLFVDQGDPEAVAAKLGKAVRRVQGRTLFLRPASRFDVLRRIIREEGFLPFNPQPVPNSLRLGGSRVATDDAGKPAFTLRPHQQRDYERFLELSAVAIFAYPQTGKSFVVLQALAELRGPKLILCPRRTLVAQWQARVALYLTPEAAAEVTITTYQGAGRFMDTNTEWSLVVFDEAHHLPADFAIEAASRLKTFSRIGLSATPRREDGNEDLIPALCGFPIGADWPVSASQRPTVTVWICKDEDEKLALAKNLAAKPVDGKQLVFTQHLAIGHRAAALLSAPFVYSKTKNPLKVIEDNDLVVISSVGNEGLSFPVRRVIELDFLFGSNMEAGQRLGRLAYQVVGKDQPGEHHVLMTADEYSRYAKRLLIYEQWGLDINLRVTHEGERSERLARRVPAMRSANADTQPRPQPVAANAAKPLDEIDQVLAIPTVRLKVEQAEAAAITHARVYVRRVLRAMWTTAFTPKELAEGLALSYSVSKRYAAACRALLKVNLIKPLPGEGGVVRYTVNVKEINRLKALAKAVG